MIYRTVHCSSDERIVQSWVSVDYVLAVQKFSIFIQNPLVSELDLLKQG